VKLKTTRADRSRRHEPFPPRRSRGASALLVCVFAVAITTVVVVSMIDTQTIQMTALRHTLQYEQALYLAGAAVQHAIALVENDPSLSAPFGLGPTEFPAGSGNTYQAQVAASGSDLVITGSGTSGSITRHLQATITRQAP